MKGLSRSAEAGGSTVNSVERFYPAGRSERDEVVGAKASVPRRAMDLPLPRGMRREGRKGWALSSSSIHRGPFCPNGLMQIPTRFFVPPQRSSLMKDPLGAVAAGNS